MKVCIITIIDYKNYGNRLQNYALNRALESLGLEVINGLEYFSKSEWITSAKESGKNTLFMEIIPIAVIRAKYYVRRKIDRNNKQYVGRVKKLREFTNQNMKTLPYLYVRDNEDLKKQVGDNSIDYYIVGSDQVWNPYYEGYDYEFLSFVDSKKKLSFSASFGVSNLPDDCKERYTMHLKEFRNLSVREKSGQKIIRDLICKESHLSVDPTLLLHRNEWEKVISKKNFDNFSGNYIVTYFLGEVPNKILQFASKENMKIYCLNDENDPLLFGEGVETFLYLIKNAKWVLTDSFHATIFSLIFNTNFYVFDRSQKGVSDMFTRLKSLLELFDLMDRIYFDNTFEQICSISKEKWEMVNKILDNKRAEEMKYISTLLSLEMQEG